MRVGIVDVAEDYAWTSAAHYVHGENDQITDWNPYLGASEKDDGFRQWYQESLEAGLNDEWMKSRKERRCIGSDRFCLGLKTENGRHRRKRGRPAKLSDAKGV